MKKYKFEFTCPTCRAKQGGIATATTGEEIRNEPYRLLGVCTDCGAINFIKPLNIEEVLR